MTLTNLIVRVCAIPPQFVWRRTPLLTKVIQHRHPIISGSEGSGFRSFVNWDRICVEKLGGISVEYNRVGKIFFLFIFVLRKRSRIMLDMCRPSIGCLFFFKKLSIMFFGSEVKF